MKKPLPNTSRWTSGTAVVLDVHRRCFKKQTRWAEGAKNIKQGSGPSLQYYKQLRTTIQVVPGQMSRWCTTTRILFKATYHSYFPCWYLKSTLGHNTLNGTVGPLCKLGGISSYKTNHSLRTTATTRLYQSGVDEQMVMELTGHRSLEGIRSYKCTSNTQREVLSDILNRSNTPVRNTPQASHSQTGHQNDASSSTFVSNSQHQLLTGLSLPSASFSQYTVNFYTGSTTPNASTCNIPQKHKRVLLYSDSDLD